MPISSLARTVTSHKNSGYSFLCLQSLQIKLQLRGPTPPSMSSRCSRAQNLRAEEPQPREASGTFPIRCGCPLVSPARLQAIAEKKEKETVERKHLFVKFLNIDHFPNGSSAQRGCDKLSQRSCSSFCRPARRVARDPRLADVHTMPRSEQTLPKATHATLLRIVVGVNWEPTESRSRLRQGALRNRSQIQHCPIGLSICPTTGPN